MHSGLSAHLNWLGQGAVRLRFGLSGSDTFWKLLAGRLVVEACLVEPGVLSDLVDWGSFWGIVAEEGQDQILEFDWEVSGVGLVEVEVVLASAKQVVEVLVGASLFKGEDSLDDDEQDYSEREQVDFGAGVLLSFLYFWGHVGESAAVALEVLDVFVASKAEVSHFQVQVVVDKDVFEL